MVDYLRIPVVEFDMQLRTCRLDAAYRSAEVDGNLSQAWFEPGGACRPDRPG
jgi:hypothetical protein